MATIQDLMGYNEQIQEQMPTRADNRFEMERDAMAREQRQAALAQATPVPEQHQQSYDHNRDMLARLGIAEAGGEEGALLGLPMNVAWNRAFDPSAKGVVPGGGSGNLESVVTPKNQFTSYNTDNYTNAQQHPRWNEALELARLQVEGLLPDMSAGNLFYRNPDTSTSDWFQDKVDEGELVPHDYRTGRHTVYRHAPTSPDPQIARDAIAKSQAKRDAIFEAEPVGGLSELDKLTRRTLDDEALYDKTFRYPFRPPSGLRPRSVMEAAKITPSVLSTAIGTDPTLGPTREDIFGVPRSAPVEPLIEGTANPYLEAASAWPPLSYGQFPVDKTRQRAAQSRENIMSGSGPSFYSPGIWGVRDWRGKVGSTRELDELEGQMPVLTGYNPDFKGGLSEIGNRLGGLNFGDILKKLLISIGGGALGIPPLLSGAATMFGKNIFGGGGDEERDLEGVTNPYPNWRVGGLPYEGGGLKSGGLISLANGGNPSVYQAGENIENLLATKMGYEGNKYSGVPNQQGMINTVNQGIGDNVKSGLRSIVANAYAQGNVPAPSVPQYNQAQLLNKGLTMLPNTANTPVPQQPQQPPAQGNISNVYAQSTLPQSHYMQPNQVT